MTKVIIELEFDNHKNNYKVDDAEVYSYLQELMDNKCLSYIKKEKVRWWALIVNAKISLIAIKSLKTEYYKAF